jgi:hypothetical protein
VNDFIYTTTRIFVTSLLLHDLDLPKTPILPHKISTANFAASNFTVPYNSFFLSLALSAGNGVFCLPFRATIFRGWMLTGTHTYTMEMIILIMHRLLDIASCALIPVLDDTNIESLLESIESCC